MISAISANSGTTWTAARSPPAGHASAGSAPFFAARADATEASASRSPDAIRHLNDLVLEALGFTPTRQTLTLSRSTVDELTVPVAATVITGTGLLLVALDAGLAGEVDDLFDTAGAASDLPAAGLLLDPLMLTGEKKAVRPAVDAVGQLFSCDEPPRFVLVCGGRVVLLADRSKWAEGRFLAVDLDAALERNDTKKGGELETISALFTADVLVPGALAGTGAGADGDEGDDDEASAGVGGGSILDELLDKSHKHAVGVSKELRGGIRRSIEILANEVIEQRLAASAPA